MESSFRIKSWWSYFLDAIDQYSLHSPFLFDFYSHVLKTDSKPAHSPIEHRRKELLRNNTRITKADFGTGDSRETSVSRIAKQSLSKPRYCRLLYRLAEYYNVQNALELGTSLGITASYLASTGANITTIEGCPQTAEIAEETFRSLELTNIRLVREDISKSLKTTIDSITSLDLVFVDANHTGDAITSYFELLARNIHDDSIIIFDDIYWSRSMNSGWNNIVQDQRVTVSIDLYQFGIALFKPDIAKQHFTLWY